MRRSPLKTPLVLLLTLSLLPGLLGGCGGSSSGIFKLDIDGPVHNLDPQFATGATARMIIGNIYEGLVVQAASGEILPGVAREYEVSADGLTYTFHLREGSCWADGTPLSGDDFVFTFRRLFQKGAPSPFATDYIAIQNASRVLEGGMDPSHLGVSAPGGETVIFQLEHPNPFFLELLASTAAMPCNRTLFDDARGRYGLEQRYVSANGPFRLETWDNTRYLLLRPNEHYLSDQPVLAAGVNLYIGRESPVDQFLDGESDLVGVPYARLAALQEENARLERFDTTTWCVVFNGRDPVLGNALIRQGMVQAVDHQLLADDLTPNLTPAAVLVPPATQLLEQSYRVMAGSEPPLPFDSLRAEHLFELGLDGLELGSLPAMTMLVPQEDAHALAAGVLQQSWQRYLGVFINIELLPLEELQGRYVRGDYQMALLPFSPDNGRIDSLLGLFTTSSAENHTGYRNMLYDRLLQDALDKSTVEEALQRYHRVEFQLLQDAVLLPLYFETTAYALSGDVTGIEISPFAGRIAFKGARRS